MPCLRSTAGLRLYGPIRFRSAGLGFIAAIGQARQRIFNGLSASVWVALVVVRQLGSDRGDTDLLTRAPLARPEVRPPMSPSEGDYKR